MCNFIYFSTDSKEDFEKLPRELFAAFPWHFDGSEDVEELLQFEHKWFLQCRYGGCSCHFRHSGFYRGGPDEGFRVPTVSIADDDGGEDADNIESTQAVYDLFARLVREGHQLDIYDSWSDEVPMKVEILEVSLADVGKDAFRFLENIHVVLRP